MADARKYNQAQKFTLAVGITTTDTSITLQSFNFPDGTAIAAGDLGTVNYGTLEPGTSREEQISFVSITTNGDGTVTLNTVVRGLGFGATDTYSTQTDLKKQHGAGSTFILSNTAAFYNDFVNKYNDETISGTISVPTPTSGSHAATKDYVDAASSGSQLAYDRIVVAGTAGESLAAGNLVYFDDTDNEWKKTDATTATTVNEVLLGIAQGSGSDGGAISGGVLLRGLDSTQTGMTVGVKLYVSDTAGAIAESAGTTERVIGFSKSATELYFDPYFSAFVTNNQKAAFTGVSNSPSSSNPFVTKDDLSDSTVLFPQVVTFTSSGTWTKDAGLKYIVVEVVGGGGAGGGATDNSVGAAGGSGGAGGYSRKLILSSALGATETVTVGSAGAGSAGAGGGNGSASSFGSHCSANGGSGGAAEGAAGAGGTASNGDINITGTGGGSGNTGQTAMAPAGGNSVLGGGGAGGFNSNGGAGGGYGAGGGGASDTSNTARTGGAGSAGIVIVTEFYS